MVGPSAMGSEKGRPTSMKEAPAFSSSGRIAVVVFRSGKPAEMKGMKAICFLPRRSANIAAMLFRADSIGGDDRGGEAGCKSGQNDCKLIFLAFCSAF